MAIRRSESRPIPHGSADERSTSSGTDENIRRHQRTDVVDLGRRGGTEDSGIGQEPSDAPEADDRNGMRPGHGPS
ncbi:hypothetical protein [Prosthecomicrobium pneumaticum]|uniref:Uncharacterized protein n=1 Tax=Prosthecomicrobium pneumaticum TaxID=81895 RepID=A0A7W9L1U9_9HYPH|nr:hypothetical protein [Prosthecomicrobium pneumaticum]MBB5752963.1 hypothetical protein [Prosthecomicrobium pneumaticum]